MEATPVKERGASYEPVIGNYEHEVYYTHEEFMDELAKQLGQAYGLADIRDAQLINPNWREQPMRAWDEVYEELCREVGASYGLNDIREA